MGGDGIFAYALDPIPANFADATTIAMLQETYLFWRIAKGGPGLPKGGGPWSSSMSVTVLARMSHRFGEKPQWAWKC